MKESIKALNKWEQKLIKKNIPRKVRNHCIIVESGYSHNKGLVFIFADVYDPESDYTFQFSSTDYGESWEQIG